MQRAGRIDRKVVNGYLDTDRWGWTDGPSEVWFKDSRLPPNGTRRDFALETVELPAMSNYLDEQLSEHSQLGEKSSSESPPHDNDYWKFAEVSRDVPKQRGWVLSWHPATTAFIHDFPWFNVTRKIVRRLQISVTHRSAYVIHGRDSAYQPSAINSADFKPWSVTGGAWASGSRKIYFANVLNSIFFLNLRVGQVRSIKNWFFLMNQVTICFIFSCL